MLSWAAKHRLECWDPALPVKGWTTVCKKWLGEGYLSAWFHRNKTWSGTVPVQDRDAGLFLHPQGTKWGITTDYRMIRDPSWLTWQWGFSLPCWLSAFLLQTSTDPSLSLMLHCFYRYSRFLWHRKSRTKGISRGPSHFVLPEPCCSTRRTSR